MVSINCLYKRKSKSKGKPWVMTLTLLSTPRFQSSSLVKLISFGLKLSRLPVVLKYELHSYHAHAILFFAVSRWPSLGRGGVGSGVFSAVNICSFPRPSERELTLFLDPVNSELWSYSFPGPSEVTLFLDPLKLLFSWTLWSYSFPGPSEVTLFLDPLKWLFSWNLRSYSFPGPSEVTLFPDPLKLLISSRRPSEVTLFPDPLKLLISSTLWSPSFPGPSEVTLFLDQGPSGAEFLCRTHGASLCFREHWGPQAKVPFFLVPLELLFSCSSWVTFFLDLGTLKVWNSSSLPSFWFYVLGSSFMILYLNPSFFKPSVSSALDLVASVFLQLAALIWFPPRPRFFQWSRFSSGSRFLSSLGFSRIQWSQFFQCPL